MYVNTNIYRVNNEVLGNVNNIGIYSISTTTQLYMHVAYPLHMYITTMSLEISCTTNTVISVICKCYPNSVSFIEFFVDFCIYDDILDTIQIIDKYLSHFKLSKSSQILHVDKTGFPRPGHILRIIIVSCHFWKHNSGNYRHLQA